MIYVLSGGQTGATLTVTSSGAGTITVSNTSLGKSYSKSVTAGGSAVFKGLATGTWVVKLSNGSKTSTKNITITSDYSTSIAYFSATIKVTYPAKSKCVIKNSSGTQVASNTNTGSSTKTWTATVNETGTYTVTATATDGSGKTKSQSVSITADGQSKSVTLSYQLYLFDNGVVSGIAWDEVSKGGNGGTSSSSVSNTINLTATSNMADLLYTANIKIGSSTKCDLSAYKTLNIDVSERSGGGREYKLIIGTTALGENTLSATIDSTGIISVDISAINGSGFISLYLDSPQAGAGTAKMSVSAVWLE